MGFKWDSSGIKEEFKRFKRDSREMQEGFKRDSSGIQEGFKRELIGIQVFNWIWDEI